MRMVLFLFLFELFFLIKIDTVKLYPCDVWVAVEDACDVCRLATTCAEGKSVNCQKRTQLFLSFNLMVWALTLRWKALICLISLTHSSIELLKAILAQIFGTILSSPSPLLNPVCCLEANVALNCLKSRLLHPHILPMLQLSISTLQNKFIC